MPRVADHEERRTLIARTFQHHVVQHGLAATTFARVAAAAGISVGLIQHYFENRDALLRFVYVDALRRRDDRIAVHIAEGEAAQRPIRDILATAVRELLPLDDVRTEELHVTLNLLTQALHDPSIADVAAGADRDLQLRASIAVSNGKLCGEVAPEVDADAGAARILATSYGLATQLALAASLDEDSPTWRDDRVDAVLDPVLDSIFTGRCRHYDSPAARG
jgi:AcrR family transcriptional regulator